MGEKDEKEEKVTQDKSIHVNGPITGVVINTGNIEDSSVTTSGTSYVITTQTITIDKMDLEKMPKEYADSLQAFTADLNKHLADEKASSAAVKNLQDNTTDLAKEIVDVKQGVPISEPKKFTIGIRLSNLAKAVVKACPKFAQTIVSMTPLAPISGLVGTAFDKLVAYYLKEPSS